MRRYNEFLRADRKINAGHPNGEIAPERIPYKESLAVNLSVGKFC